MVLAAETAPASDRPTFNRGVASIIYDKCTGCHRPGEVAPFSLISYEDAKKGAALIAEVTKNRAMPPWKQIWDQYPFINEGRVSDAEIATLQKCAAAGAPEGDPSQKPAPPHFSEGWSFGNPDDVVTMPESVQIPADGPDLYRCFVLATNVPADRYVSAFEFRPGNRRVVHHAILFVDTTGVARKQDAATRNRDIHVWALRGRAICDTRDLGAGLADTSASGGNGEVYSEGLGLRSADSLSSFGKDSG
jgi:hypothetical protein